MLETNLLLYEPEAFYLQILHLFATTVYISDLQNSYLMAIVANK